MTTTMDRLALLEMGLHRAVAAIGDPTEAIIARYYARFPDARASFDHWGLGKREKLEAEMVENTLYCVMTWFERPTEIGIIFAHSVPHHHHTLHVDPAWFTGLIDETIAVLTETLPPDAAAERALWAELHAGLSAAIADVATW